VTGVEHDNDVRHRTTTLLATLVGTAALLAACQSPPSAVATRSAAPVVATAEIKPTAAAASAQQSPSGSATFTPQTNGKLLVEARIAGLKPNSEHGFHVHEVADCSGDGTKTGAHFNPDSQPHNHPAQGARHAGAFFNLKTDANGVGTLRQEADTVTLVPGKYSIVGKPVIVHRDADDYQSQPLGNAGPRIACGLIALR
jgi:superoxide dismutase, Cu-Zn family